MSSIRSYFFLLFLLAAASACCDEDFIDLRTFIKERTQQYPLNVCNKIYLNTPPRTGSTLVYNVLRFLFENDDHKPWDGNFWNLIVKSHGDPFLRSDVIYITTIRDPVEACLSQYRVYCSQKKKILPIEVLYQIVHEQLRSFKHLEKLVSNKMRLIILEYEEIVDDLRFLFSILESKFNITIDPRDKDFLQRALSKENVIKNAEKMGAFASVDDFSLIHGSHIDRGEQSKDLQELIRIEILERLSDQPNLFQKWGYLRDLQTACTNY